MLQFKSIISIFMLGEIFSAWGLWGMASIGMIFLARCVYRNVDKEPVDSKKYAYLLFGIIAFLIVGLVLMWHAMSVEHTRAVREILADAYLHPALWGAKK